MLQYLIDKRIENNIIIKIFKEKLLMWLSTPTIISLNTLSQWVFISNNSITLLWYNKLNNNWKITHRGSKPSRYISYNIYYIENTKLVQMIENNTMEVINNYFTTMDNIKSMENEISQFKKSIGTMDIDPSKPIIQNMFDNLSHNPLNTIVDKIYFINLEERTDRLHKILKQFNQFNITNYKKIVGINGYNPEYNLLWKQLFIKSNRKISSPGVLGYLLSMKKVILDAIENNYNRILILDDDILIHKNIIHLINNISIIPNNWVLLYLGCSQLKNWNKINIIKNFYYDPKSSCDGSFAIIITSKIFKEMIELIDNSLLPFDTGALRIINSRYPNKCWAFYPNLIIADVRDSNIRTEGGNNYMYQFSRKCRWNLSNYYFE